MENTQTKPLDIFLNDLENKVNEQNIKPDDIKQSIKELDNAKVKIQGLLNMLKDEDPAYLTLYRKVAEDNYAHLVDSLNTLGYHYRKKGEQNAENKTSHVADAFEKMSYRLMELTRTGKRDEVFYNILRICNSFKIKFDKRLLLAFQHPNNEMFKVLIYSFLSGIIQEKEKKED